MEYSDQDHVDVCTGEGLVSEADLVPAVPAAQTEWTCPVEVSGSPWNDTQAVCVHTGSSYITQSWSTEEPSPTR